VTTGAGREQQIHTIVQQQTADLSGHRRAPIITTTLALLEAHGVFGAIWATTTDTARRQPLLALVEGV
jgi:hypothetical protein